MTKYHKIRDFLRKFDSNSDKNTLNSEFNTTTLNFDLITTNFEIIILIFNELYHYDNLFFNKIRKVSQINSPFTYFPVILTFYFNLTDSFKNYKNYYKISYKNFHANNFSILSFYFKQNI